MEKYKIHINLFIVALGIVDLAITANNGAAGLSYASGLSYWETFYYISLPETAWFTLFVLLSFNMFFKNREDLKEMVGNSRIEQLEAKIAQMEYHKMFAITMLFSVFLFSIPFLFPKFNQMLYEDLFNQLLNGSLFLKSPYLIANVMSVAFLAGMYFWGMSNLKERAIKMGKTHPPA